MNEGTTRSARAGTTPGEGWTVTEPVHRRILTRVGRSNLHVVHDSGHGQRGGNEGAGGYGEAAPSYLDAGWVGPLPLPAGEKSPPPKGFTGEDGVDPNSEQIDIWREKEGDGNTALRLPDGAVGVDVDAYDAKQGGATLEALETTWGPLPPTWISTSRIDTVSGIRLYRIPPGVKLAGDAGAGIEILQHHHRYAVVWPSINPMTNRRYRWYAPDGSLSNRVPRVDELPELPAAWVSGLTAQSLSTESPRVATTPSAHWSDEVKRVHGDALTDMATGRSRHDTVTQAALAL